MKTLIADTNIFLRFFTKDILSQAEKVKHIFHEAEKGRVHITVLSITIVEILFQLEHWYKFSKVAAVDKLMVLLSPDWIDIDHKDNIFEALEKYKRVNIDFVDVLTWSMAKSKKAQILSFDKDFDKLQPSIRIEP